MLMIGVSLLAVGLFARWELHRQDSDMRNELLRSALLVSQAVDAKTLSELPFAAEDRGTKAFSDHQAQMRRLSRTMHLSWAPANDYVSIYSMKQQDGKVVFGPESIPENTQTASPPGTVYKAPPIELEVIFQRATPMVIGPFSDEYGTFVSAFVPVFATNGQATGVVIGMDIMASNWNRTLLQRVTVLVGVLVVFSAFLAVQGAGAIMPAKVGRRKRMLVIDRTETEDLSPGLGDRDTGYAGVLVRQASRGNPQSLWFFTRNLLSRKAAAWT